ncbi:M20 family metallopeptidase [uncultured Ilyobacter sp.]|uniref:M20 metallopeptidase family protein n=1 Tax=uncultured Ilyobacter sp. TaxID=544433 RepID=UPI0029C064EF|nr:M20 family metallopeptidase [uncultured Ilyobacter sp.]
MDLKDLGNQIKTYRRELHQIPELGLEEYKTCAYIGEKLKEFGLHPFTIAKTGVYVYIDAGSDETYAFRADMDALEAEEENDVEYASKHPGKMHACGHDGHMAMLLGLAKVLSKTENIKKNILLIFQPAEEGPGGAKIITESGIFEKYNVKGIFGIHLFPTLDEGIIASKAGPFMAQSGEIDVIIKGEGGHGGMPHNAIDSILVASKFLSSCQSIISRSISPLETAVISFGKIRGGSARNIVAEKTHIEGTVRTFSKETFGIIKKRILQISKGLEESFDVEIDVKLEPYYPPVINDKALYKKVAEKVHIEETDPVMLAEDFSYYQEKIPGVFYFLGSRNRELGFDYPLHSCSFNFDEKILLKGIEHYINILTALEAI